MGLIRARGENTVVHWNVFKSAGDICWAADHIKDGVRVNVVSPGTVLSPSLEQRIQSEPDPEAVMNNYVSRQPLGRLGTPEEIATAILFASSEEAGFLDGANICIDGAGSL